MNFSVNNLTTERKWRAATGFAQERFRQLVPHFKAAYFRLNGTDMTERGAFAPHGVVIKTEEELLFFTLFSFKANLTYDLLGLVSGLDGSNAKRNQELGISVLKDALAQTGHAPKREFATVIEFEAYFHKYETLLVDGTEQRKQRPGNKEEQKDCYSGKKVSALKELVISGKTRWIGFISRCRGGSRHDYSLLKECFPADKEWFKKFDVRVDLGFLGFAKDYVYRRLFIPIKKPKGKELTSEQREVNKQQAKERITVEHSIGGLKRYRVLEDRLRLHDLNLYDDVLEVCAGLWNFSLKS